MTVFFLRTFLRQRQRFIRDGPLVPAVDLHPQALARASRGMLSMGLTAEQLASAHGIERRRQEEFALASHEKAARAGAGGLFDDEIVRVIGHDEAGAVMEAVDDQSIRPAPSPEAMAALQPGLPPKLRPNTGAPRRAFTFCCAAARVASPPLARGGVQEACRGGG